MRLFQLIQIVYFPKVSCLISLQIHPVKLKPKIYFKCENVNFYFFFMQIQVSDLNNNQIKKNLYYGMEFFHHFYYCFLFMLYFFILITQRTSEYI
jgi:hypothetical protein